MITTNWCNTIYGCTNNVLHVKAVDENNTIQSHMRRECTHDIDHCNKLTFDIGCIDVYVCIGKSGCDVV